MGTDTKLQGMTDIYLLNHNAGITYCLYKTKSSEALHSVRKLFFLLLPFLLEIMT